MSGVIAKTLLLFSCLTLVTPAFAEANCQRCEKKNECSNKNCCCKGQKCSKKGKRCGSSRVTCYQKGYVRDDFGDEPASSWPSRRDGELSDQLGGR